MDWPFHTHTHPHPGTWTSKAPDNGFSSCHQSLSLAYATAFCQDQVSWGDPLYIWGSFPYTPCCIGVSLNPSSGLCWILISWISVLSQFFLVSLPHTWVAASELHICTWLGETRRWPERFAGNRVSSQEGLSQWEVHMGCGVWIWAQVTWAGGSRKKQNQGVCLTLWAPLMTCGETTQQSFRRSDGRSLRQMFPAYVQN